MALVDDDRLRHRATARSASSAPTGRLRTKTTCALGARPSGDRVDRRGLQLGQEDVAALRHGPLEVGGQRRPLRARVGGDERLARHPVAALRPGGEEGRAPRPVPARPARAAGEAQRTRRRRNVLRRQDEMGPQQPVLLEGLGRPGALRRRPCDRPPRAECRRPTPRRRSPPARARPRAPPPAATSPRRAPRRSPRPRGGNRLFALPASPRPPGSRRPRARRSEIASSSSRPVPASATWGPSGPPRPMHTTTGSASRSLNSAAQ